MDSHGRYPYEGEAPPPAYSAHDPYAMEDAKAVSEPSAPPPPSGRAVHGLDHLTYDQIVEWWNSLQPQQYQAMLWQLSNLSADKISELRAYYRQYIPKDYYPRLTLDPNQLGASDYYLIYYLYDEIAPKIHWMASNTRLKKAFEIPPPSYEESEEASRKPPTFQNAEQWWNGLSQRERDNFFNRSRAYTPDQKRLIRREFGPYYRCYYWADSSEVSDFDLYDYYLMSRYSSRFYGYPLFYNDWLFYSEMYTAIEVARLGIGLASWAAHEMVALGGMAAQGLTSLGGGIIQNSGGKSSDCGDVGKALLALAVIGGIILAAISALVASLYVGLKAAGSLYHLVHGHKVTKSLFRLGAMIGGAYLGAVKGMVVGALIGSCIPGIGTGVGAIIGAIFGAPIAAALCCALAKHLPRLISYCCTGSTNPRKWNVAEARKAQENTMGRFAMTTAEIRLLFNDLQKKKNTRHRNPINPLKGSPLDCKNHAEKARYNKFLDAIKQGHDPRSSVRVDAHTRFRWGGDNRVVRENVALPALKGGLRI